MSVNGGNTWTNFSDGLPNLPVNCVIYENNTNNALYVGTDVGVYYRNNDLSSWISFNNGLPNVIVMELEIQYPSKKLRAATYGRGVWESDLYRNPAAPAADFVYIETPCSGIVNFTDISSGVPDSWYWDFGDGNTATSQNPVHTYSSLGSYPVQLIVTNSFGTDTVDVMVVLGNTQITCDFTASLTQFCSVPAFVSFTNLSQYVGNFLWDFGDGTTSTLENPTHTYGVLGDYTVTLIVSALLCEGDTLVMQDYISINESNVTELNMLSSGSSNTQCCSGILKDNGGDSDYSNNVTSYFVINPPNATEITLTFTVFDVEYGDVTSCIYDYIAIYDGPSISSPLIGKYCNTTGSPGTITSSGGSILIKQYSDGYVEGAGFELEWNCETNGISEKEKSDGFIVFPNPASDILNIVAENPDVEIRNISILNITGSIVENISCPELNSDNGYSFGIKLANGIYIIEIETFENIKRYKLIIE
jgi:PKD repeat protein